MELNWTFDHSQKSLADAINLDLKELIPISKLEKETDIDAFCVKSAALIVILSVEAVKRYIAELTPLEFALIMTTVHNRLSVGVEFIATNLKRMCIQTQEAQRFEEFKFYVISLIKAIAEYLDMKSFVGMEDDNDNDVSIH